MENVLMSIGLLNVKTIWVGLVVTVEPLAGVTLMTRSTSADAIALTASTRPKPPWLLKVFAGAPLSGRAPAWRAASTCGRVMLGTRCRMRATTAATFGDADDVPKKVGRFRWLGGYRFVGLAGSPGN